MPSRFAALRDLGIFIAALLIGLWSAVVTYKAWFDERNARLVEIGIGVLRDDPTKGEAIKPVREWAMKLIDANAGVKFSDEARAALLGKPFPGHGDLYGPMKGYGDLYDRPEGRGDLYGPKPTPYDATPYEATPISPGTDRDAKPRP